MADLPLTMGQGGQNPGSVLKFEYSRNLPAPPGDGALSMLSSVKICSGRSSYSIQPLKSKLFLVF